MVTQECVAASNVDRLRITLHVAKLKSTIQYRSKISYHPLARRDSRLERRDTRLARG